MRKRTVSLVRLLVCAASFPAGAVGDLGSPAAAAPSIPRPLDIHELQRIYAAAGESVVFSGLVERLGKNASTIWTLAKIYNSIPSSSRQYEPPKGDIAYAAMTSAQLQERYGQWIAARSAVEAMQRSPGSTAAIRVLSDQIETMYEEIVRRN